VNSIYRCNNNYEDIPLILFLLTEPLAIGLNRNVHCGDPWS